MLAPDTLLQNRYLIVRPVGQGGMGAVYMAQDQRLHSIVALKESFAGDEQMRRAFEREAELLANLHHPALPNVIDHFTEGKGQFLVMQFIKGEDLGAKVEQQRRAFPPAEVLRWADQLLDALDYLHTQEPPIIHRDIKPQNLKLTGRGQVILLDFGLAKGAAGQMTSLGGIRSLLGFTPNFAPLEQIQGEGTDARSDLYSLGATLYYLLTGVMPPDALLRSAAVLRGQPDPLQPVSELNPEIPATVTRVLHKAMAQNPGERPQTAAAMREALRDANALVQADLKAQDVKRDSPLPPTEVDAPVYAEPAQPATDFKPLAGESATGGQTQQESEPAAPPPPTEREIESFSSSEQVVPSTVESPQESTPDTDLISASKVELGTAQPEASAKRRGKLWLGIGLAVALVIIIGLALAMSISMWSSDDFSAGKQPGSSSSTSPKADPKGNVSTERRAGQARPFTEELKGRVRLEMVAIPAGTFLMGSSEPGRSEEWPQHQVTVPGFYMSKYEVTQAQWRAVMGTNPSNFKGDNLPVENVSWNDAAKFCRKLSQMTGREYRLPSEAEWEYACRAGTTGEDAGNPDAMAWHDANTRSQTHPVGQKQANAFGLYDMHGNVWEWCLDYLHVHYKGAPVDGSAWLSKEDKIGQRIVRGGSRFSEASHQRCANRFWGIQHERRELFGLRLVTVVRQ